MANRFRIAWHVFLSTAKIAAIWRPAGRGEVRPLTERDRWIVAQVAPDIKKRGLYFVGLDVIGDCLTEINVTSPTCLREIEAATGEPIAANFIAVLLQQLQQQLDARA
jgi:glutathione synthase